MLITNSDASTLDIFCDALKLNTKGRMVRMTMKGEDKSFMLTDVLKAIHMI